MRAKLFKSKTGLVPIFVTKRIIQEGEELEYSYGNGKYFWRQKGMHFEFMLIPKLLYTMIHI